MAEIIQEELRATTQRRMTPGERRFAQRLKSFLDSDYLCWYDISIGKQQRYPDFIVLHPARGLLFLEVKDWKPSTLKKISKERVSLLTNDGQRHKPIPLSKCANTRWKRLNYCSATPCCRPATIVTTGN